MAKDRTRNLSLDGLRGIAVLLVLLFHHAWFKSGWIGVDLFFALSGFLITTILRRTREDAFYWREFWVKRVTRILPPLVLLLVAAYFLLQQTLKQIAGYFLLADVFAFAKPVDGLVPLWSLAVEEHFYMLWPFAVRFLSRRSLIRLLLAVVVAEPLFRAAAGALPNPWQIMYFLTPFRLDGLCLGSLLAILLESAPGRDRVGRWSGWGCCVCACGLLALRPLASRGFDSILVFNSLVYSVVGLGAAFLIGYVVTYPRSIATRLLAWRGLAFTGSISYGLYLYQVLVRSLFLRSYHLSFQRVFWLDTPVVFVVAWLSFRFYETPLILWGKRKASSLRVQQDIETRHSLHG